MIWLFAGAVAVGDVAMVLESEDQRREDQPDFGFWLLEVGSEVCSNFV